MIGANNDLVVVSPAVRARNGESGANIRIKLHEKPFQLLLALLEDPGEVVDRRQLQERLWPDHTFVDFENGLNNAVGRLRKTLGDTAENPQFIETMPRHGYRYPSRSYYFIAEAWDMGATWLADRRRGRAPCGLSRRDVPVAALWARQASFFTA